MNVFIKTENKSDRERVEHVIKSAGLTSHLSTFFKISNFHELDGLVLLFGENDKNLKAELTMIPERSSTLNPSKTPSKTPTMSPSSQQKIRAHCTF